MSTLPFPVSRGGRPSMTRPFLLRRRPRMDDADPRTARIPDHGPRDNFRSTAGRSRPRAWRGWGFRAGGAARSRARGSPRKRFRGITSPRRRSVRAAAAGRSYLEFLRRLGGIAQSANGGAGLRPARPAGRRRTQARFFFTDERDREGPRPGRRAPGSPPLPTSPLPGGRRENGGDPPLRPTTMMPESPAPPRLVSSPLSEGRREDGATRLPVRPSRAFPNGTLTPPSGREEE